VFESTFTEGSTHQGPIVDNKDKSGIVSLPYGLEAICPARHMRKEDESNAQLEETLDFVIIEFNKNARKIVVSHTRTFEEGEDSKPAPKAKSTAKASKGANKANTAGEKSTLGDLDALAELKEKMDKGK
jgi:small subunit ribosomal protein S1